MADDLRQPQPASSPPHEAVRGLNPRRRPPNVQRSILSPPWPLALRPELPAGPNFQGRNHVIRLFIEVECVCVCVFNGELGFMIGCVDEGGVSRGGDGSVVVGSQNGSYDGDESQGGCCAQDEIRYLFHDFLMLMMTIRWN